MLITENESRDCKSCKYAVFSSMSGTRKYDYRECTKFNCDTYIFSNCELNGFFGKTEEEIKANFQAKINRYKK